MSRSPGRGSIRHRLGLASRVLAAGLGGYGVTALVSSVLTLALERSGWIARADAVLWVSLFSFALYAAVVIWVFAVKSVTRAWCCILVVAILCVATIYRSGSFNWIFLDVA